MNWKFYIVLLPLAVMTGCSGKNDTPVYNGRLEADTVTLSAMVAGTVDSMLVEEGDAVTQGQLLCKLDDARSLAQQRLQAAQLSELQLNRQTLNAQIRQLQSQLDLAKETLGKTEALVRDGAATSQKRDELQTSVDGLSAQMDALNTQRSVIDSKEVQLRAAMDITALNLADAHVLSPLSGRVLNAFMACGEAAVPGMPLFDMADLSILEATIYVPLKDLAGIKLGQKAEIAVDGVDGHFQGEVRWIASESEFTPKTILTQETRTTLVYAVKITVPNPENILKIGMPIDVTL